MKSLVFTPVIPDSRHTQAALTSTSLSPGTATHCELYVLHVSDDIGLLATRHESSEEALESLRCDNSAVAVLRSYFVGPDPHWALVASASRVALNNQSPCLPVVAIEPGDLLGIDERFWLISSLWQPEAVEAPEELRDKPCPVCGGELRLAPVVQCICGRWTHLENAAAAHDIDALNCFMASATCGGCGRPASLEPQAFPDVSDWLADRSVDDDEFESR